MRYVLFALWLLLPGMLRAQPSLTLALAGPPVSAFAGGWPACDRDDISDAPARAIRLADGTVQLYAADQTNRVNAGPNLLNLHHDCAVVYRGAGKDDPAAFDDRTWIATPWTDDGRTIWAIMHNEFHGNRRPWLCPTGRYMDCWYNAITIGRSVDNGRTFHLLQPHHLLAAIPYRYDQVGLGHHGYFGPSNVVRFDGADYMFVFATAALDQRGGNCLLRTEHVPDPTAWRGWDGSSFTISMVDPYAAPAAPAQHICAPVGAGALRWPITSLVRHAATGTFVALMQDASRDGGVHYATSPDLLHWSLPGKVLSAPGWKNWTCGDPDPIAYPSLIDPASADRNFTTTADAPLLFATRFDTDNCRLTGRRTLIRWQLQLR